MAKYVQKIDGDYYALRINEGGDIFLDVGSSGKVTVTGDLDVAGDVTQTTLSEVIVQDNTIELGDQDQGGGGLTQGMAAGFGGLIFDRGTLDDAQLFFTEIGDPQADALRRKTIDTNGNTDITNNGVFELKENVSDNYWALYTSNIGVKPDANLYLINQGTGVVTVSGTVDYEKQIFPYDTVPDQITPNTGTMDNLENPYDEDALVNTQLLRDYTRDYHKYNFQDRITLGTDSPTEVRLYDQEDDPLTTSRIELVVDGLDVVTVYENRLTIENLELNDNFVTTSTLNGNLVLKGNGTGNVEIPDSINFTTITDPSTPVDGTKLYSKALGDGGTGLYFVNQDGTNDELVSRNKALLYSIIF